jgi:type IV secretory pathway component VirB8
MTPWTERMRDQQRAYYAHRERRARFLWVLAAVVTLLAVAAGLAYWVRP